jgi:hypothetical protein
MVAGYPFPLVPAMIILFNMRNDPSVIRAKFTYQITKRSPMRAITNIEVCILDTALTSIDHVMTNYYQRRMTIMTIMTISKRELDNGYWMVAGLLKKKMCVSWVWSQWSFGQ